MNTTSAFIAITGKPNVGKSSLLNRILGQKLAAVSSKPQTTRTRIMGVYTKNELQLVFLDTPGLHRPRNRLGDFMVKTVADCISGVDPCIMVAEPYDRLNESEEQLIAQYRRDKMPVVLAINKIDTVKDKEKLLEVIAEFTGRYDFDAVVPISAKTGEGVDELLEEIKKYAFESPHFFDDDVLTDMPEKAIVAEIIREKFLLNMQREVPHGLAVSVEKMLERGDGGITDIEAIIYCEKQSHKPIIIGKSGSMLKKVGSQARHDIEEFLQCRVNLQCWVKVKEDWRNKQGLLRSFGFESE